MIGGARIISAQAAEFTNSGTGAATPFPASLNFGFQEEVEADDEFAHEGDEREFPGLAVGDEAGVACLQGRVLGRGGGRILRGRFEGDSRGGRERFEDGSRTIRERFEDDSRASGRRKRRQPRPANRAMALSRAVGERDRWERWPDPCGKLAGTFGEAGRILRGTWPEPSGTVRERFEDDSRTSGRRKRGQTTPATSAMAPGGAKPGRALGFAMRTWPG